jgi:hypothetical protein
VDRHAELRDAIDGSGMPSPTVLPLRLCEVGVQRLGVQGVGVALISSPQSRSLLSASGKLAGRVEELQFSLGEGPCLDAFSGGVPTLEPDLSEGGRERWPLFSDAALAAGIHAVFSFPLQIGVARFGVLDVASSRPGMLAEDKLADALALADIAAETILAMQSDSIDDEVADALGGVGSGRIVVHQATGMVAAQATISVEAALAWLRARASAHDLLLHEVATEVVARRLTFTP